ncbi:MAG: tRNA pseudouridine(55) synthase TruB [Syntrophomonas sp.]|uniref:tRNA pseudouridine(55) synthase TruB n=1 Tax=Syntrophomonas sp. TaxID=2053627 RepID=UPI00261226BB|nr:tRNA pseudouridine(55) synthase TruB [Syntrophomonas sp.]MDD2510015.1 tRNA pseudouridine(55) synthase TruB [Syntrophomonas sp.]MDD3879439.1 tRNA pseudouridine(55) synthase TruB [Syntrophomonas sp.]MDD4626108.1 tRNA pseudouridine(55) synthase TruB [Syntrophomonas sp.]
MDGFLNINKSQGMTSFDVIRKLKRSLPRKYKLGHLGTLDPMAEGVLPVAIGQGTRIIAFVEDETKEYLATMTLGALSDTQDAWGEITYSSKRKVEPGQVEKVLALFRGKSRQIPPMYSAVHHEGKRLYELARQGLEVERKAREIEIFELELLDSYWEREFPQLCLRVSCSRGTYIRTLCHDIGQELGTGAYLSSLCRSRSACFKIEGAISLDYILEKPENLSQALLPMDYPLKNMPLISVRTEEMSAIINGNQISRTAKMLFPRVRLYSPEGQLLAIAKTKNYSDKTVFEPCRVFKIGE